MLRSSRFLAAAVIAAHVLAAATLIPLDFAAWIKCGLAALVAGSLAWTVRRHVLLASADAITAVEIQEKDHAAVETRAGARHDARVLGTTYVSPLLTVLNLRLSGRMLAQHVLIVPDNVDRETFRRLRVMLRWADRQAP